MKLSSNIYLVPIIKFVNLTCNVCKVPWVVCITELGLLTRITFPFGNCTDCILDAVWITDCWFGCITDCTWKYMSLSLKHSLKQAVVGITSNVNKSYPWFYNTYID